ncbi:MAG: hypothetical protein LIO91_08055 [Bacteroidales bacterium]|nr:hypothetical protein [Bacteroidales bacterium]
MIDDLSQLTMSRFIDLVCGVDTISEGKRPAPREFTQTRAAHLRVPRAGRPQGHRDNSLRQGANAQGQTIGALL